MIHKIGFNLGTVPKTFETSSPSFSVMTFITAKSYRAWL